MASVTLFFLFCQINLIVALFPKLELSCNCARLTKNPVSARLLLVPLPFSSIFYQVSVPPMAGESDSPYSPVKADTFRASCHSTEGALFIPD